MDPCSSHGACGASVMLDSSDGSASAATIVDEQPTPDNTPSDQRRGSRWPHARGRPDSDREGPAKAVESLHETTPDDQAGAWKPIDFQRQEELRAIIAAALREEADAPRP